ncbi:hypothetical protein CBR64_00115 [Cellulosimicrobium cellulans]|uniref:Phage portal protein n=1 Tax=Cellulosimicrobium cellulans TaxID=1710 RepID=A0A1Y0HRJ2_CELCE|nr:phage portal protein [Cellulosimicrobium cellulans]ARU50156.1 hypothetical protein CBR64_00115 [Cellulosimicrobium cellulans]
MSIRSALELFRSATPTAVAATGRAPRMLSPWADGTLTQIALADIFGTETVNVSRGEAISVPAVANARWLVCTPLAKHPLKAYRGETAAPDQPAWLYRTNGNMPPQFRMLWTLDDLLFTGFSLWFVQRGAKGQITDAARVPRDWWYFDEDFRVKIIRSEREGGDYAPASSEVILFTSPMDPLLEAGARTIRAARKLEETWTARVQNPIPVVKIRQTEDLELDAPEPDPDDEDAEEFDELAEGYDIARVYLKQRNTPNGSVVVVPYGWDVEEMGTTEPALFIEGRNAVALDVARFTALPPGLLAASQTQASLTYSTKEGDRSQFVDYSLAAWAMAIEARLSMDDCVPAGTSVKFDLEWLTEVPAPTTTPPVED